LNDKTQYYFEIATFSSSEQCAVLIEIIAQHYIWRRRNDHVACNTNRQPINTAECEQLLNIAKREQPNVQNKLNFEK